MSDNGWRDRALCIDKPDGYFPTTGEVIDESVLDRCWRCPVREECLEYALEHKIKHGIWGGMSNRQREKIRRARRVSS